jgi:hypothetical protein
MMAQDNLPDSQDGKDKVCVHLYACREFFIRVSDFWEHVRCVLKNRGKIIFELRIVFKPLCMLWVGIAQRFVMADNRRLVRILKLVKENMEFMAFVPCGCFDLQEALQVQFTRKRPVHPKREQIKFSRGMPTQINGFQRVSGKAKGFRRRKNILWLNRHLRAPFSSAPDIPLRASKSLLSGRSQASSSPPAPETTRRVSVGIPCRNPAITEGLPQR